MIVLTPVTADQVLSSYTFHVVHFYPLTLQHLTQNTNKFDFLSIDKINIFGLPELEIQVVCKVMTWLNQDATRHSFGLDSSGYCLDM